MTASSEFVFRVDHKGIDVDVPLTAATAAFEVWLKREGYDLAVNCCPVDSGEYLFAVDAHGLVQDFLSECSEEFKESEDELLAHADEIGQVSNAFSGDGYEGPDDAPEEIDAANRAVLCDELSPFKQAIQLGCPLFELHGDRIVFICGEGVRYAIPNAVEGLEIINYQAAACCVLFWDHRHTNNIGLTSSWNSLMLGMARMWFKKYCEEATKNDGPGTL